MNNTSGVKGVWFDKINGKYVAEITVKGKKCFIGRFDELEDANKAYMSKAAELLGD